MYSPSVYEQAKNISGEETSEDFYDNSTMHSHCFPKPVPVAPPVPMVPCPVLVGAGPPTLVEAGPPIPVAGLPLGSLGEPVVPNSPVTMAERVLVASG